MSDTQTEAIGTWDFEGNSVTAIAMIDAARVIYESFEPTDHFCIRCNAVLAERTIGYCLECLKGMASSGQGEGELV